MEERDIGEERGRDTNTEKKGLEKEGQIHQSHSHLILSPKLGETVKINKKISTLECIFPLIHFLILFYNSCAVELTLQHAG